MYDLVAEGANPGDRWRKRVQSEMPITLGRQAPPWETPWDSQISRRHAELTLVNGRLKVTRLAGATNPIFYRGESSDNFTVGPNEKFVIGRTAFWLVPNRAAATQEVPIPIHMRSFSDEYLRKVSYRDVRGRLEILGELPNLIAGAGTEVQLYDALARLVLRGVLRAQTVAIVSKSTAEVGADAIEVIHWDCRRELADGFQPSEKLICEAIDKSETVLHVWRDTAESKSLYTMQQNSDWAFVCPLNGAATRSQAIYVSGQSVSVDELEEDDSLQDDMKFVQIAGATYSSLSDLRRLEQRQSSLRSFFSPVVVDALASQDINAVLEPRECRLSILFCDLRGFSGASEQFRGDLLKLLDRVSRALGVMTGSILDHRGVVGDFHGDSVMGFWGWPIEQPDAPLRACHAALSIAGQFRNVDLGEFEKTSGGKQNDFMMGLGIATGSAVAGKIGSADQVKVTAFGPVVNLAARLETLTRAFHVPILCDEETAKAIHVNQSQIDCRVRKLVSVLPSGFLNPVPVWQILPDMPPYNEFGPAQLEKWDLAVQLLVAGKWPQAWVELEQIPADDRPREFIMDFIRRHNFQPPPGWAGSIPQQTK